MFDSLPTRVAATTTICVVTASLGVSVDSLGLQGYASHAHLLIVVYGKASSYMRCLTWSIQSLGLNRYSYQDIITVWLVCYIMTHTFLFFFARLLTSFTFMAFCASISNAGSVSPLSFAHDS